MAQRTKYLFFTLLLGVMVIIAPHQAFATCTLYEEFPPQSGCVSGCGISSPVFSLPGTCAQYGYGGTSYSYAPMPTGSGLSGAGVIEFYYVETPDPSSCVANQGASCSAGNACGTNSGTVQCDGSCSASAPSIPASYGSACSSAANSCGQTNTGTVTCSGWCSVLAAPANPAYLGQACTSGANSCGMTNSGTLQCGGWCSASTPPDSSCPVICVPYQGQSCTSGANSCGMTNTGTYSCNGSCSASTPPNSSCPVCSANQGQACTSAPNACGQRNSGTYQCNGSCSASTPGIGAVSIGTFSGSPNLVPSGGSSTLTLSASNVITSCVIKDQTGATVGTYTPSSCGVSASVDVGPITTQEVYTVTCDGVTTKTTIVGIAHKYIPF